MSAERSIVIVGAGHAGVQAAASLREEGIDDPIRLISKEEHLPYERPPLSKAFLQGAVDGAGILLRDDAFYTKQKIDLLLAEEVVSVDRTARKVLFSSSASLAYSHLVLATGSGKRALFADTEAIEGVMGLRSMDDASKLRAHLHGSRSIVVVGAGFIGMEFAAVAVSLGCDVEIIEAAGRPLARSVSGMMSDFLLSRCLQSGVRFHFGESVRAIEQSGGKVRGVRLASGRTIPADLVLVGIGARPLDDVAVESGLPCPNGIAVDETLATADPDVSAIGDCAWHPNHFAGRMLRLECVQNAADQARVIAKRLAGKSASYRAVPWFWSDIGASRLQIAGLLERCDRYVRRGRPEEQKFSIFGFRGEILTGVESVNKPADHLLARRFLASEAVVRADDVADEAIDLKQLLAGSTARGH